MKLNEFDKELSVQAKAMIAYIQRVKLHVHHSGGEHHERSLEEVLECYTGEGIGSDSFHFMQACEQTATMLNCRIFGGGVSYN
jgi:hypothetical protein